MYKFCSSPWDTIAVNQFGQISPCLCGIQHTRGYYGDLNQQSLKEILESQWMQEFRQSIIDQSYRWCNPKTCSKLWNLDTVEHLDFLDQLPSLPTSIMLQLDKNCNLKCASCRTKNIYSNAINQQVLNILAQLSRDYAKFNLPVEIFADGLGDIFASAAYLEYFTNYDIPQNFRFILTTNGNLITKNLDLINKIQPKLQSVTVSLDAATDRTYRAIRGGNFNIVLDGIKELTKLGIPVNTEFVLQYLNHKEVVDYIQLCQDLGISHIGVNEIVRWPHMSLAWWNQNKIQENDQVDYKYLENAVEVIRTVNAEAADTLQRMLLSVKQDKST